MRPSDAHRLRLREVYLVLHALRFSLGKTIRRLLRIHRLRTVFCCDGVSLTFTDRLSL